MWDVLFNAASGGIVGSVLHLATDWVADGPEILAAPASVDGTFQNQVIIFIFVIGAFCIGLILAL
jgi:hypothetical protein